MKSKKRKRKMRWSGRRVVVAWKKKRKNIIKEGVRLVLKKKLSAFGLFTYSSTGRSEKSQVQLITRLVRGREGNAGLKAGGDDRLRMARMRVNQLMLESMF
jgi:hypothetical protein